MSNLNEIMGLVRSHFAHTIPRNRLERRETRRQIAKLIMRWVIDVPSP